MPIQNWQETVTLPIGVVMPRRENEGPAGTPACREVTIRKMTGHEEALLADPRLRANAARLITALLGSCITSVNGTGKAEPDAVRRMYSGDRNFLLLELRRLTFGDEMEAHYRCPQCQEVTVVMEDLSSLDVRRLEDGEEVPEIRVTLRDGYRAPDGAVHCEFVFGLPTGEDEELAAARRDANPSRQRDALLARCLKEAGDLEPRRLQATGVRILADLSIMDRRRIQKAVDEAAPGPDLTRSITCEHCGGPFRTTLDMSRFFPLA